MRTRCSRKLLQSLGFLESASSDAVWYLLSRACQFSARNLAQKKIENRDTGGTIWKKVKILEKTMAIRCFVKATDHREIRGAVIQVRNGMVDVQTDEFNHPVEADRVTLCLKGVGRLPATEALKEKILFGVSSQGSEPNWADICEASLETYLEERKGPEEACMPSGATVLLISCGPFERSTVVKARKEKFLVETPDGRRFLLGRREVVQTPHWRVGAENCFQRATLRCRGCLVRGLKIPQKKLS